MSMSGNEANSINELPSAPFWDAGNIYQWEGCWLRSSFLTPAKTFKSNFNARNDDILLASTMKTGTTWLKALVFCITNQKPNVDSLITDNPHFHVPTIELVANYSKPPLFDPYDDESGPRLMHTHLPYTMLPDSVKEAETKIVFIARNPKDTLISSWHFFNSFLSPNQDPFPLQKAVDCFCSGVYLYGPFFDYVLNYWIESQKRPDKILFLKYEELKSDPIGQVRKIADFLGQEPFEGDEEVDEILKRCSLEKLKGLEATRNEPLIMTVPNSSYFRKGVVGDSKNYLSPEMEEQIDQLSRIKLQPFGLFL